MRLEEVDVMVRMLRWWLNVVTRMGGEGTGRDYKEEEERAEGVGGGNNELRQRRLGSLEGEKRRVLTRRGYISESKTNNGGFEAPPANFLSYL